MLNPTSVIGLISFAPAIFLLYKVIGDQDKYFKHNKLFFMVALGMLVGMIVGIFTLTLPLDIFMISLGVVILLELTKFVILLSKPFRLKHDATFYGMAMGIGIAPMMVFLYGYFAGLTEISLKTASFIALMSVSYTFTYSSTGAFIGYGCYKGELWKFFIKAVIVSGIHGLILSMVWADQFTEVGNFALLFIAVVYSTLVLFYIVFEVIPKTIPKELKQIDTKKV
ncbi:MAG: hypothetical protein R6U17_00525 [Thermoplasmata archaeon]